ncbi:hypothetical protein SAMN00777080_1503 [Aquiflexum balticum DSM 16537]|uniref:Uncharacterized protein n=1 Tax=Aquiflexum balticum DSM 16537 TaxID=758820 RepID=A0A1W2H2R6_9BACT|nr:hypothetical protein SAMN00777080_1503 [Aquiflexum balticum DSM 16537]
MDRLFHHLESKILDFKSKVEITDIDSGNI